MSNSTQSIDLAQDMPRQRLRLWLRILKTSRRIEAELRERLRVEFGSTLPRFDVMAALARAMGAQQGGQQGGLRMSALSGVLRVSNGNVTGIVDRLVEDGFVIRVPVEDDRRATIVRLTPAGQAHFDTLARAHAAWVNDLLSSVTPTETQALTRLLARINDHPPQENT